MRISFLPLLIGVITFSCNSSDVTESAAEKKQVEEKDDQKESHENTEALQKQNQRQLDSLLNYFDFVQSDFSQKSYYNKHWWKHYWLRAHILMAGVDSSGNYFLTLTTYFHSDVNTSDLKNTEVWVYYENDTVKTNSLLMSDTSLKKWADEWGWIGTWNPLVRAYDQASCREVMKFISDNREKSLHYLLMQNNTKVESPYTINKKNRNAIAQCYELGACLQRQMALSDHDAKHH